ncbi:GntR family transcriptional regulator [Pandoraea thiooxydans]|nr:GntR family transcriptional regulator [Pandoraea thiooxydans]
MLLPEFNAKGMRGMDVKVDPGVARRASLRRSSMHEATAQRLREMIQEGELAPGQHINERELCEAFDISKTPLREALKILTLEGHVTHRQHMGFRVAPIDLDELASIFEVLHGLEEMTGRLLAERIDDATLARLMEQHQRMAGYHRDGKRLAYYRANQEIHVQLVAATGNPVLASMYATLMAKVYRARGVANADVLRWQESSEEHEAIMQALRERDAGRLAAILRFHSEHTAAEVMKILRGPLVKRSGAKA